MPARAFLATALLLLSILPARAQTDQYLATIGANNAVAGNGNNSLRQPTSIVVDHVHNRVFVADSENNRVQVYDSTGLSFIATIGSTSGLAGADNAHFDLPGSVAIDEARNHLFVADTENDRVQVFDTGSFAYVATIGGLIAPDSVAVDPVNGNLLVVDVGNLRIQVYSTATLALTTSIGKGGTTEPFLGPVAVSVDTTRGRLLVLDGTQNCVFVLDSQSFAASGTKFGSCAMLSLTQIDEGLFDFGVAADPAKDRILLSDTVNNRILVFNADNFAQTGTIGTTTTSTDNSHFDFPFELYADQETGRLYVADTLNNRVQVLGEPLPTPLAAAVLPGSRSVEVGASPTVFATILNAGAASLNQCEIGLPPSAPSTLSLSYQPTDPSTNAVNGPTNTPLTIAGHGSQSFVLTFSSPTPLTTLTQPLTFVCAGALPAAVTLGVNTIDLSVNLIGVPDVIALAATNPDNGILTVPFSQGQAGAFAVATDNIGLAATLNVSVDTGGTSLPLSVAICQTNPTTGACLSPAEPTISATIATNAQPTFSIFATASGSIPLQAATNRVFVRFKDGSGNIRGSTSVAVATD